MDTERRRAAETALFSHLVCRPEAELDLAQAALAIAAPEYPGLDIGRYLRRLDELAERAYDRVYASVADPARQALVLVGQLLRVEGFRGNTEDYGDPRNSFLNEVLDRRVGIPISLAVVMIEVARRLEVPLQGVSFPGHFLLRIDIDTGLGSHDEDDGEEGLRAEDGEELEDEDPEDDDDEDRATDEPGAGRVGAVFIDPFTGRSLSLDDLKSLLGRLTGEHRAPRPAELQIADKRTILSRMLGNLRGVYERRTAEGVAADAERLALVNERLRLLQASARPAGAPRLVH